MPPIQAKTDVISFVAQELQSLGFTSEAPAPTTAMYCAICLEHVRSSLIFQTTKRCNHSFCRHCISQYIVASTTSGVVNVQCPGLNCEAVLDPLYCEELVPGKQFIRWCDLLCESAVLGFAKFYCPNSNCQELIIGERGGKENVGRFKCPSCNQSGCFRCARPWFERHRCNDVHRNENIHLLECHAERKKWKRCPHCNIYVERRWGCPAILCRCGTRFCYRCGGKISLYGICRDDCPTERDCRIIATIGASISCAIALFAVLTFIYQLLSASSFKSISHGH